MKKNEQKALETMGLDNLVDYTYEYYDNEEEQKELEEKNIEPRTHEEPLFFEKNGDRDYFSLNINYVLYEMGEDSTACLTDIFKCLTHYYKLLEKEN